MDIGYERLARIDDHLSEFVDVCEVLRDVADGAQRLHKVNMWQSIGDSCHCSCILSAVLAPLTGTRILETDATGAESVVYMVGANVETFRPVPLAAINEKALGRCIQRSLHHRSRDIRTISLHRCAIVTQEVESFLGMYFKAGVLQHLECRAVEFLTLIV